MIQQGVFETVVLFSRPKRFSFLGPKDSFTYIFYFCLSFLILFFKILHILFVNTTKKIENTLFSALPFSLSDVLFSSEGIGFILLRGCTVFCCEVPHGQAHVTTHDAAVNIFVHGAAGTWASTFVRNSSAFHQTSPAWPSLATSSFSPLLKYPQCTDWQTQRPPVTPSPVHQLWFFHRIWSCFLPFSDTVLAWLIGEITFVPASL